MQKTAYSVTPGGWAQANKVADATQFLFISGQVPAGVDGVVPEPVGGAHRDPAAAVEATGRAIAEALESLGSLSRDELREARAAKFLGIGRKI